MRKGICLVLGAASLVIQTVLPALFLADGPSTVTVAGGTHNPWAPPFDFLAETFLPAIGQAGFQCGCRLMKHGFFPSGGGKMAVDIEPLREPASAGHQAINICRPGQQFRIHARIYTAELPNRIARRQEELLLQSGLDTKDIEHIEVRDSDGPGNAVCIRLCGDKHTTVFTAFGMRGKPSEKVIGEVAGLTKRFLESGAAADRFLADQLLICMAVTKGGCYTTEEISTHTGTNMEVIKKFLPVDFVTEKQGSRFRVTCKSVR
jgi:RNA 3'-terminal phosphate cyclase (ATP)